MHQIPSRFDQFCTPWLQPSIAQIGRYDRPALVQRSGYTDRSCSVYRSVTPYRTGLSEAALACPTAANLPCGIYCITLIERLKHCMATSTSSKALTRRIRQHHHWLCSHKAMRLPDTLYSRSNLAQWRSLSILACLLYN